MIVNFFISSKFLLQTFIVGSIKGSPKLSVAENTKEYQGQLLLMKQVQEGLSFLLPEVFHGKMKWRQD